MPTSKLEIYLLHSARLYEIYGRGQLLKSISFPSMVTTSVQCLWCRHDARVRIISNLHRVPHLKSNSWSRFPPCTQVQDVYSFLMSVETTFYETMFIIIICPFIHTFFISLHVLLINHSWPSVDVEKSCHNTYQERCAAAWLSSTEHSSKTGSLSLIYNQLITWLSLILIYRIFNFTLGARHNNLTKIFEKIW